MLPDATLPVIYWTLRWYLQSCYVDNHMQCTFALCCILCGMKGNIKVALGE